MKRYFYRDPLAAAWMAKHFGMRFANGDNFRSALEVGDSTQTVMPFEIHPDSLPLLMPRDGDEGIDMRGRQVRRINGGWHIYVPEELEFAGDIYSTLITKIDKRNGIPFHWPEEEATGDGD